MLTEVEEELSKNINSKETVGGNVLVGETHDNEKDSKDDETHELNSLSANSINCGDGNPVSGDGTTENNDDVTNSSVVEVLVDVVGVLSRVANNAENGSVVQRETIEGHIKRKP